MLRASPTAGLRREAQGGLEGGEEVVLGPALRVGSTQGIDIDKRATLHVSGTRRKGNTGSRKLAFQAGLQKTEGGTSMGDIVTTKAPDVTTVST